MKKIILPLSFALAQMLAVGAFAQNTTGESSPAQAAPPAHTNVTPAEKAAARTERKAEGKTAAKDEMPQEGTSKSAGTARKTTRAQRKASHAKRKAAVSAENKKGEINSVPGTAGNTEKK